MRLREKGEKIKNLKLKVDYITADVNECLTVNVEQNSDSQLFSLKNHWSHRTSHLK